MNKLNYYGILLSFVIGIFSISFLTGQAQSKASELRSKTDKTLKTSAAGNQQARQNTDAAVKELKKRGQYDSLMDAVKNVRRAERQKQGTTAELAAGESVKLFADDGENNNEFGYSVAISGSTAVVGVPFDNVQVNPTAQSASGTPNGIPNSVGQGSAYIFVRNGTLWSQQQKLTANDGEAGDNFGTSVAISGDTIIVGAPFDDVEGVFSNMSGNNGLQFINAGSAYVFFRSGTTWNQQEQLLNFDFNDNDNFGHSVGISGDTAVVGTPGKDVFGAGMMLNPDQGAAYVFLRENMNWTFQSRLTADDGQANDQFGYSVGIDVETVVAGTYRPVLQGQLQSSANGGSLGAAYIFTRTNFDWNFQQKLTPNDGDAGDEFGISVAISGNTVIVGANGANIGLNTRQGAAYIFFRTGTLWDQQAKLAANDGEQEDNFGFSVSIRGEKALVGVPGDDNGTNSEQGSAYFFERTGPNWNQEQKITASDGSDTDLFGISVAISGSYSIVGAKFGDVGANSDQGSAYIFRELNGFWTQEDFEQPSDGAAGDQFGMSVAVSGDTAVIGTPGSTVTENSDQGAAYVFVRDGTLWIFQQKLTSNDGEPGDNFGAGVSISGDTIIIGAPKNDRISKAGSNVDEGAAYVFVRSGTNWIQQQKLRNDSGGSGDNFGASVAIDGSLLIIGTPLDDVQGVFESDVKAEGLQNIDQGSATIFINLENFWTTSQQIFSSDGSTDDNFGTSVAINGDTVIVGAPSDVITENLDQGSAYIFKSNGEVVNQQWNQQQKLTAPDGGSGDLFGTSVGIFNNKAIVGSPSDNVEINGNVGVGNGILVSIPDQGSAYVFLRDGMIWNLEQKLTASDGAQGDYFGISVAINGNTAVVGAYYANINENPDQGAAYVFERDGTNWIQKQKLSNPDGAPNDNLGTSVAVSGDKVVVGSPFSDFVSPPVRDKNSLGGGIGGPGAAVFFVNAPLAPTAASVSVSGRVLTETGRGLTNAVVMITDLDGNKRFIRTGTFGYYRFDNIAAGETYILSVRSKRYRFAQQVVSVSDNIANLDFIANGSNSGSR